MTGEVINGVRYLEQSPEEKAEKERLAEHRFRLDELRSEIISAIGYENYEWFMENDV